MKNISFFNLLTAFMLLCSTSSLAHDFEVGGIFYKITDEDKNSVAVTYKGKNQIEYDDEYSGSVVIPSTVKYKGKTYNVTEIGYSAFWYCGGLTEIIIGDNVKSINENAFSACVGLVNVTIPNGVESILYTAFDKCSSLESITIPASVINIESSAFQDCKSLTEIVVENGNTTYDSREGCNAIIETKSNTLVVGCKSSTIPSGITAIGESAFSGCSELKSIEIPSTVTQIGHDAFFGCYKLTFILSRIPGENIFDIDASVFEYVVNRNPILYVPAGATAAYSAANGWKEFTNIIETYGTCGSNATWELKDSTLFIKGTGVVEFSTSLAPWNALESYIESVKIEEGITAIGENIFSFMPSLASVEIQNSVTTIGNKAFYRCEKLVDIKVGNNITSFGDYAFQYCTSLTEFTIPESTENIGRAALSHCNFKSIIIPSSVKSIGYYAFDYCEALEQVVIGEGVTSIGAYAFDGCSKLRHVTVISATPPVAGENAFRDIANDAVLHIPLNALDAYSTTDVWNAFTNIEEPHGECGASVNWGFDGNTLIIEGTGEMYDYNSANPVPWTKFSSYINKVIIREGVTTVGKYAFYKQTEIQNVELPSSITDIKERAFRGCTKLEEITIPYNVQSIGGYAFNGCTNLAKVTTLSTVPPTLGTEAFKYIANNALLYLPNNHFAEYMNSEGWKIFARFGGDCGENLIWEYANGALTISGTGAMTNFDYYYGSPWSDCKNYIKKVIIEEGVTSIGEDAFFACSGLASITIPNSVTSIEDYAFYNCSSLASITIPNSVTSIGSGAFNACTGLTSITIPNSVISIGSSAFNGCTGLASIVVDDRNRVYDSRNNCNAIIETATNTLIAGCKNTKIPNSVTSIGYSAFARCTGLTSITIPNSVTSIGSYAFEDCTGLTSITIPNSVTSIGSSAFYGTAWYNAQPDGAMYVGKVLYGYKGRMPDNTSFIVKEGTTEIAGYAFRGCTGLTSITIPNSVTSIGDYAFYVCSGLESITIPNSVTSIGSSAFYGTAWYNAQPDGAMYVGKVLYDYIGTMPDNTSFIVKEGTTEIAEYAFGGCTGLTSLKIPGSVTSIEYGVFEDCCNLRNVYIEDSDIALSLDGTFGGASYEASAFCYTALKTLYLGRNVTGSSLWSFSTLESITIGEKVTTLNDYDFNCSSNTKSITSYIPGDKLFEINDYSVFEGVNKNECTLYVPLGSKDIYATTDGWNEFINIVEIDTTSIDDIIDSPTEDNIIYDLRGNRIIELTKPGIYIVNGKKVIM